MLKYTLTFFRTKPEDEKTKRRTSSKDDNQNQKDSATSSSPVQSNKDAIKTE